MAISLCSDPMSTFTFRIFFIPFIAFASRIFPTLRFTRRKQSIEIGLFVLMWVFSPLRDILLYVQGLPVEFISFNRFCTAYGWRAELYILSILYRHPSNRYNNIIIWYMEIGWLNGLQINSGTIIMSNKFGYQSANSYWHHSDCIKSQIRRGTDIGNIIVFTFPRR